MFEANRRLYDTMVSELNIKARMVNTKVTKQKFIYPYGNSK